MTRLVAYTMSCWLLGAAVFCTSCGDDPTPSASCTTFDETCVPLYEPTFDLVFARTLKPTCASSLNCHGSAGKQGRITFTDADQTYSELLARGVVKPGDVECSAMTVRIASPDPFVRMPPGRALSEGEVCAIGTWIANGARR